MSRGDVKQKPLPVDIGSRLSEKDDSTDDAVEYEAGEVAATVLMKKTQYAKKNL